MTERLIEADDYNDDTSQEDDVTFNESGERVFTNAVQNRLSFLNDILGTNRPTENLGVVVEDFDGHMVQMSVPPPER